MVKIKIIMLVLMLVLLSSSIFAATARSSITVTIGEDKDVSEPSSESSGSVGSSGGGGVNCNSEKFVDSKYCRDYLCPIFLKFKDCTDDYDAKHLCCVYYYDESPVEEAVEVTKAEPVKTVEEPKQEEPKAEEVKEEPVEEETPAPPEEKKSFSWLIYAVITISLFILYIINKRYEDGNKERESGDTDWGEPA